MNDGILRFSGAVKRQPAIDVWLSRQSDELGSIARKWFAEMRDCGADVGELMHDGCPVVCVADIPFAYVNVFKAHVNVGFYQGAALEDPAALLVGTGKRMRHVRLRPGSDVDTATLNNLIRAAYLHVRALVE
jgi:hypothetical protein